MDDIAWVANFLQSRSPRQATVKFKHPLVLDEARWFRRAVELHVIDLDECRPPNCTLPSRRKELTRDEFLTPTGERRHLFRLFTDGRVSFSREYIPHIAALARTILHFGYPRDRYSLSLFRNFQRDYVNVKQGVRFETDAEFYAPDGSVQLHIEAKANHGEVYKLVETIQHCSSLTDIPSNCQKELEYILDVAPKYVWLVAPGCIDPEQYVYAVRVQGIQAEFRQIERVPPSLGV